MAMDNRILSWDTVLEEQEERPSFVTLPEGDYPFTVKSMEKCIFNGSEKIPSGTPYAELGVSINGGSAGTGYCKIRLFLLGSHAWKIQSFLSCVGLRKHGEKLNLALLEHCEGESGVAHFSVTKGQKEGQTFNNADYFIERKEEPATPAWGKTW